MTVKAHIHTFHALHFTLGPHAPLDVYSMHVHPCEDEDCDRVLIGMGRHACSGSMKDHHRDTLPLKDQQS